MARIRTIKPEFFTSEDIVELSPLTRLFYISLWCEADREGRLAWKPKTLKLRYFPGDDKSSFESSVEELTGTDLISIYEVDGSQYCEIPSFVEHQVINNRESVSKIPAKDDDECKPQVESRIPKNLREKILNETKECVRCGSESDLTIDHILPQSLGGDHRESNLRVMCRSCNASRPVQGEALRKDLKDDGYDIDALKEDMTRESGVKAEWKGKERKGREGKGTRAKVATTLPDDFSLTDKMREWFGKQSDFFLDIDKTTSMWKDSMLAKGYEYKDWVAAWRTGMNKAHEWHLKSQGSGQVVQMQQRKRVANGFAAGFEK